MQTPACYLRSVHLKDVRRFSRLIWKLPEETPGAGWHVLVGDNGAGKTTLLRAMALSLIGRGGGDALRMNLPRWVRRGEPDGLIKAELDGVGRRSVPLGVKSSWSEHEPAPGVFAAGYGPFRRFGSGKDTARDLDSYPEAARLVTLFDEKWVLEDAIEWVRELRFSKLLGDKGADLDQLLVFINQDGFLPSGLQLHKEDIASQLSFQEHGVKLLFSDLSDGYRSILSLTLDLLRATAKHGILAYSEDATKVTNAGIVFIDEVDVHLHPTWQRTIGQFFVRHFPQIQFIVASHSPLVCHAAELGSIFQLPDPGDSDDEGRFVTGIARARLLYGDIGDAFSTGAFGPGNTRSASASKVLDELAALNIKRRENRLTPEDRVRRAELMRVFPEFNLEESEGA